MYKIQKSQKKPDILAGQGKTATRKLVELADFGATEFEFESKIYANTMVKAKLKADQNGKCAYCERPLGGDYGAVEHFRPKGGYTCGGSMHKPGYYWLAYDWNNLLLSCSECNTGCKKNQFPIADERTRDIVHRDISHEVPLLINPAVDNPKDYICFDRFIIKPQLVDGKENDKGRFTIDILKLNERNDLVESRRRRWEEYSEIRKAIEILEVVLEMGIAEDMRPKIEKALSMNKDSLRVLESDESEFTGMFRYQIDSTTR